MDTLVQSPGATATRRKYESLTTVMVVVSVFSLLFFMSRPRDTLVSDSPDGSKRITVREGSLPNIDRNFRVVLINRQTGQERVLYISQDQIPSIQRERFVWTKDSSKVVLLGDRYWVKPDSSLPNGEIIFLVYDTASEKMWSNEELNRSLPGITSKEVLELFGDDLSVKAALSRE